MRSLALKMFIAVALLAASILSGGCEDNDTKGVADDIRQPMVLFAVDGFEWDVIAPLLAQGKLPTIASLMERGVFGKLESMRPTYSPVIWTTIATGRFPVEHGIRGFVYDTTVNGQPEQRYYTSGHRQTKAFWNILSDFGLKVHTIGWWITYPAEPVNGLMVSQTNTTAVLHQPDRAVWKGTLLKGVEGQVYPPERQNEVMDILAATDATIDELTTDIFGEFPNEFSEFSRRKWEQSMWSFRADATYINVAQQVLAEDARFDLLALYIGGPDVIAHRFWRYAHADQFANPPRTSQIENFARVVDDYYVYVDRAIASVLALLPDDATIMIVSDHGMRTFNTDADFTLESPPIEQDSAHHLEAPPGVFIAAGPTIRASAHTIEIAPDALPVVGSVLDIAPTILALKGVPVAQDMYGDALDDILEPEWLARAPIRFVATHDSDDWEAARQSRIREAVDQNERLEQLRSLGYIR